MVSLVSSAGECRAVGGDPEPFASRCPFMGTVVLCAPVGVSMRLVLYGTMLLCRIGVAPLLRCEVG